MNVHQQLITALENTRELMLQEYTDLHNQMAALSQDMNVVDTQLRHWADRNTNGATVVDHQKRAA